MRILLAEDEPFLAQIYESFLVEATHQVTHETEGDQVLFRMKNSDVDLVILDIFMPKKTGFDVLEERLHDTKLQDIPVIVLSGSDQQEIVDKALQLGADDFFDKNTLELEPLLNKITSLADKGTA